MYLLLFVKVFLTVEIPGGRYFALRPEVAPSNVNCATIREVGEITIRFGELAISEIRWLTRKEIAVLARTLSRE